MHGAASADDEVALVAELGEDAAYAGMQMRIKARVHADDGCGRALFREHADEDEICVVDPVKFVVWPCVKALLSQCCNALFPAL